MVSALGVFNRIIRDSLQLLLFSFYFFFFSGVIGIMHGYRSTCIFNMVMSSNNSPFCFRSWTGGRGTAWSAST